MRYEGAGTRPVSDGYRDLHSRGPHHGRDKTCCADSGLYGGGGVFGNDGSVNDRSNQGYYSEEDFRLFRRFCQENGTDYKTYHGSHNIPCHRAVNETNNGACHKTHDGAYIKTYHCTYNGSDHGVYHGAHNGTDYRPYYKADYGTGAYYEAYHGTNNGSNYGTHDKAHYRPYHKTHNGTNYRSHHCTNYRTDHSADGTCDRTFRSTHGNPALRL